MEHLSPENEGSHENALLARRRRLFAVPEGTPYSAKYSVSRETQLQAVARLGTALYYNKELVSILGRHLDNVVSEEGVLPNKEPDIVEGLRTNADLRLEAGTYFLQKIDQLAAIEDAVPQRIADNIGKSPDSFVPNVRDMTSREYAAFLCLAKLDGTFDDRLVSPADEIAINADGYMTGQSRFMADVVLGTVLPPKQA